MMIRPQQYDTAIMLVGAEAPGDSKWHNQDRVLHLSGSLQQDLPCEQLVQNGGNSVIRCTTSQLHGNPLVIYENKYANFKCTSSCIKQESTYKLLHTNAQKYRQTQVLAALYCDRLGSWQYHAIAMLLLGVSHCTKAHAQHSKAPSQHYSGTYNY